MCIRARFSNAKRYFNEDVPFEPILDETRVRMNKPAWFVGTTLASGLRIKESLQYYQTYDLANAAAITGDFIPDTDAVTPAVMSRVEAELRAKHAY